MVKLLISGLRLVTWQMLLRNISPALRAEAHLDMEEL